MQLTLGHRNKLAHIGSKLLLKRREVNVTIAVRIKDILHKQTNVLLRGLDLVLNKVSLEVLVRNKTIAICVECSKAALRNVLGTAASCVDDAERAQLRKLARHCCFPDMAHVRPWWALM